MRFSRSWTGRSRQLNHHDHEQDASVRPSTRAEARDLVVLQPESTAQPRRISIAEIAAVAGLCVLALVLRLRGVGYLLPVMPLSDGIHIIRQVDVLRGKQDLASKEKFFYPQLLPRMTTLLPDAGRTGPLPPTALEDHLRMASEPWR